MSQPIITYNIKKLNTPGGVTPATANAAVDMLDSRIDEANSALNDLSLRIEELNTKSAILRQHVPLAEGVFIGSLVYYDVANARFDRAQALTLAETTASGNTIEAPQARVEGLVIGLDSAGGDSITGTLLCGGYWEDFDLAQTCLENETSPRPAGTYYLSPVTPGKATMDTYGHLRQPVLSYYGDGKFSLSIFYMAHDNHYHASQLLNDPWVLASTINGSTVNGRVIAAPTGAQYVYGGAWDYGLGAIGETTAVFRNGVLQNTIEGSTVATPFVIKDNYLWYCDSDQPAAGEVTIFNHYPFAYDTAVVRGVESTSDSLTVVNTNGLISITANDFVNGAVIKGSYAIASIDGNKLNYTPVVTDISAGPGISVVRSLDGGAYISTAAMIGGLMDAYSINHNGTTLISDGSLQYITFPAKRTDCQFVMVMPIQGITSPCSLYVWAMKLGSSSVNFQVTASFIPDPTVDTETSTDLTEYTENLRIFAGTSDTALRYGEVLINDCVVSGNGLLVATVALPVAMNEAVQLLRTGFKLSVINNNIDPGEDTSNSITQTMVVGDDVINAGQAVMIYDGKLIVCKNIHNSLLDTTNMCVGIAMETAHENESLTYMITGTMTAVVANAQPGQSLYINTDGTLTAVSDTTAFLTNARYLQKVGTMLTGNKIQVNIESAVGGHI